MILRGWVVLMGEVPLHPMLWTGTRLSLQPEVAAKPDARVQGNLAHEKTPPPPRTLSIGLR